MKKIVFSAALIVSLLTVKQADAQVRVNVNVNIGSQPNWGPSGYDYVDYYYLPDIETYYYVPTRQFIYLSGNRWVFSYGLPSAYRGYNLYTGYKVVINQHNAYHHFHDHKIKYKGYKGYRGQGNKGPKFHKMKGRGKGKGHGRGH